MDSFKLVRRRTNDLVQNVQQNLPAMPQMPSFGNLNLSLSLASQKQAAGWTMNGTWERIQVPPLPRSSHSLDIVSSSAYIFGGEINPREPVDNDMHVVVLPFSHSGGDYYRIKAAAAKADDFGAATPQQTSDEPVAATKPASPPAESGEDSPSRAKGKGLATDAKLQLGNVPEPRVGHATAVIGTRIFMFGGRGGPEMQPLDEAGRVWVFDTRSRTWSYLDPVPAVKGGAITPHPSPRSYHCATSTDRPREFAQKRRPQKPQTWRQWALGDISKTGTPQNPIVGHVAEGAVDQEADGYGTFFVHGGCLANGDRTNDLWAFDVRSRTWTGLPAAPGPARGGTAIAISKSRLFRFGGYDGENEIGGQLDFLPLELETFDDQGTKGEVAVRARGGSWQTILQNNIRDSSTEIPVEPVQAWPAARSVASFHAITLGGSREYLVVAMGETSPSAEGHSGAGHFIGDVWTFQVPPLGMTTASFTDAILEAAGRKTGEGRWIKVATAPHDEDEDYDNDDSTAANGEPAPRGWLASAPMTDVEDNGIVLWGGVGQGNKRLGDGWVLRLG